MAEHGSSAVDQLVTKHRNQLQILKMGDLRLLSDIEPRVNELALKHQVHPSH